jgi:chromosomal replication initiator protein
LTSDKAPVDMQDIEQRLLSRFKWDYQPSYISQIMKRVSILKNILYRDGVEIIEYVARNIKSNVRELKAPSYRLSLSLQ